MASSTRTSPPMYFPPATFDLADAVTCADLVGVAYDQYAQWVAQGSPTDPKKFTWTPAWPRGFAAATVSPPLWGDAATIIFDNPEPFGFVVQDASRRGFLVLRGTESDADWYNNLTVEQTAYTLVPSIGNVHDGFFAIYASMSPAVLAAVQQMAPTITRFFFAGHSLGSALVTLAVPDVVAHGGLRGGTAIVHYNFASPRVGDETFSTTLNELTKVPCFRVVNTEDVVPDVPLAVSSDLFSYYYYKHVGTPVDFTAQYDSIGGNHSMLNCYLYAVQHPTQPEGPIVKVLTRQPSCPRGLLRPAPSAGTGTTSPRA